MRVTQTKSVRPQQSAQIRRVQNFSRLSLPYSLCFFSFRNHPLHFPLTFPRLFNLSPPLFISLYSPPPSFRPALPISSPAEDLPIRPSFPVFIPPTFRCDLSGSFTQFDRMISREALNPIFGISFHINAIIFDAELVYLQPQVTKFKPSRMLQ